MELGVYAGRRASRDECVRLVEPLETSGPGVAAATLTAAVSGATALATAPTALAARATMLRGAGQALRRINISNLLPALGLDHSGLVQKSGVASTVGRHTTALGKHLTVQGHGRAAAAATLVARTAVALAVALTATLTMAFAGTLAGTLAVTTGHSLPWVHVSWGRAVPPQEVQVVR